MPATLFQKVKGEGNAFLYLCQDLNLLCGQYNETCEFQSNAECPGLVQSPSVTSVEVTLLLVPVLGELRVVLDPCKTISPFTHAQISCIPGNAGLV